MRVPDRPWADIDGYDSDGLRARWDLRVRPDDLADRLRRLAPGHPSADRADDPMELGDESDELDGYDEDLGDVDLGNADVDYTAADDLEPDSGAATPAAGDLAGRGPGLGQAADITAAGPADKEREPYRPWFMADGASEPWFAIKHSD